jgi:hypothetical protein
MFFITTPPPFSLRKLSQPWNDQSGKITDKPGISLKIVLRIEDRLYFRSVRRQAETAPETEKESFSLIFSSFVVFQKA